MFRAVQVVGGKIKVTRLPYPIFPSKLIPYTKGRRLICTDVAQTFTDTLEFAFDVEMISVAIACSSYAPDDYWEMTVGTEKIFESIYLKELPESFKVGASTGVFPIPAGTNIQLDFYNVSGIAKDVWFNIKTLK